MPGNVLPPVGGLPWPTKIAFFFLTGLVFALLADLTNSILPGLVVHVIGLLAFFTLIWPNDPARPLTDSVICRRSALAMPDNAGGNRQLNRAALMQRFRTASRRRRLAP
jgi:hypothetical protein